MDSDSRPHIDLATSDGNFRIHPEHIENLVRVICSGLGVGSHEVSWDFVEADDMRSLNRQYRGKDRSTDVLSFPQEEWESPLHFSAPDWPLPEQADDDNLPPQMLGDVIISPSDALANAKSLGHGLDRETCFLLVHGILHLCGHDHMEPEEEARMIAEQQSIMKYLETASSAPLWTSCIAVEV